MDSTSYRLGATEKLALTTSPAASSGHGDTAVNPVDADRVVRIQADVNCLVLVGPTPVVSASNGFPVTAGVYEYIDIPDGCKLSAMAVTGVGNLYITDVSKV
ncbi:hypothetical protein X766_15725 [Mesorhizobium sp. LSJC255A00]|uniref:hypothetical protein n=1 Tax=Mesorhizobium sp. LSJC255A00 TaxID=1287313 RepID=UPI0003CE9944|nr:hypothetical protein [Mesorhizobium sp. LSJC255A00]ESX17858.1 hypothetical protein X766_15725 [Mesorhizobium sp. LSJC255A00]